MQLKKKSLIVNRRKGLAMIKDATSDCMDCLFWYRCKSGKIDCPGRVKSNP